MTGLHQSYFIFHSTLLRLWLKLLSKMIFIRFFFSTGHIFVTPMSLLNHGVFDFVYICKDYGSDPILFVQRW